MLVPKIEPWKGKVSCLKMEITLQSLLDQNQVNHHIPPVLCLFVCIVKRLNYEFHPPDIPDFPCVVLKGLAHKVVGQFSASTTQNGNSETGFLML